MGRELVDLAALDLTGDALPEEELRRLLPHRHEFQMIDGVCFLDVEEGLIVGYKDWDENPWWAAGHVPGRPLMPGVLMAEAGAQIATVLLKKVQGWGEEAFIGLAGLENVRYRGQVTPPGRVYFVSRTGTISGRRMARYPAQAFFEGKLVMEMGLLGVIM